MGQPGAPISSLKSLVLDLPPSCVEFSPANPSYFLVGTYNLQSNNSEDSVQQAENVSGGEEGNVAGTTQRRDGSIIVFRTIDDSV